MQPSSSDARLRSALRPPAGRLTGRELFRRWQQNRDKTARDELFDRFLPLARRLARRYVGANEPFEDLLQVASYGLLKALDRYDPDRGAAFSSFAVPTILGELKRYFRDHGWGAHVPRGAQELALKVQQAQAELTQHARHPPTVQELAQYLEMSVEDVLTGLDAAGAHHSVSLDAPSGDREGETLSMVDSIAIDDVGFALAEDMATVSQATRSLSELERRVLVLRFFRDLTQTEIAQRVGVSQMQISRILRRTIDQLNELTRPAGSIDEGEGSSSRGRAENAAFLGDGLRAARPRVRPLNH